jgi:DNA-binding transcriptional LysR family regulator
VAACVAMVTVVSNPPRWWAGNQRNSGSWKAEDALIALNTCTKRHVSSKLLYRPVMARPDLNLLVTLDVLLAEGNVARAARRLRLSPSAMSRALARLRKTTGDPLLVRAGRGLVPTPRALELRDRVGQLVEEGQAVLRPVKGFQPAALQRTFVVRSSEGFVENFGAALLARVQEASPAVRLRFVQKADKESGPLREGSVDLETGVVEATTSPELRAQSLFRDRLVGVVRAGHPLARGRITVKRFAAAAHILVTRNAEERGPIDDVLEAKGMRRDIAAIVSGFAAAVALARGSDLVATVPERHTGVLRERMHTFVLPLVLEPFTVSMLWHPRLDADPGHRWFRTIVRDVCGSKGKR